MMQDHVRNDNSDKFVVHNYIVLFVDMLGQKSLLENMLALPRNESEKREFGKGIRRTWGAILQFRKTFRRLLCNYSNIAPPAQLEPVELDDWIAAHNIRTGQRSLSDSVVTYIPLFEDDRSVPSAAIYFAMLSAIGTFVAMIAAGKALRGGLALGPGWEEGGDFYGPSLACAYVIERDVANWPRLVVSPEVKRYLWAADGGVNGSAVRRKLSHLYSSRAGELLKLDVDGELVIDYLGAHYRNTLSEDEYRNMSWLVQRGLKKVRRCFSRYRKENNEKLILKYEQLLKYYELNIHRWTT